MLSNEDIVLLLTGITKQFQKDAQSHWSPTAFVAVVEGDGSSFLGRDAGAAWVLMAEGRELHLGACLGALRHGQWPWECWFEGKGVKHTGLPFTQTRLKHWICSLCARQHSNRKRYSPSSVDALFYQGEGLLNASKNLSLTTICSQVCISGHLCGFKWGLYLLFLKSRFLYDFQSGSFSLNK